MQERANGHQGARADQRPLAGGHRRGRAGHRRVPLRPLRSRAQGTGAGTLGGRPGNLVALDFDVARQIWPPRGSGPSGWRPCFSAWCCWCTGCAADGARGTPWPARTRVLMVDDQVLAASLARRARTDAAVGPGQVLVTVHGERVEVQLSPTSGTPVKPGRGHRGTGGRAAAEPCRTLPAHQRPDCRTRGGRAMNQTPRLLNRILLAVLGAGAAAAGVNLALVAGFRRVCRRDGGRRRRMLAAGSTRCWPQTTLPGQKDSWLWILVAALLICANPADAVVDRRPGQGPRRGLRLRVPCRGADAGPGGDLAGRGGTGAAALPGPAQRRAVHQCQRVGPGARVRVCASRSSRARAPPPGRWAGRCPGRAAGPAGTGRLGASGHLPGGRARVRALRGPSASCSRRATAWMAMTAMTNNAVSPRTEGRAARGATCVPPKPPHIRAGMRWEGSAWRWGSQPPRRRSAGGAPTASRAARGNCLSPPTAGPLRPDAAKILADSSRFSSVFAALSSTMTSAGCRAGAPARYSPMATPSARGSSCALPAGGNQQWAGRGVAGRSAGPCPGGCAAAAEPCRRSAASPAPRYPAANSGTACARRRSRRQGKPRKTTPK